jgi:lipopolysaccharide biosynthesis glycosyltransferase
LHKFCGILLCGEDDAAFEEGPSSLRAAFGAKGDLALALLFEKKRYELDPAVLRAARAAQKAGARCFFGARGRDAAREVLDFARECESEILFFLRADDVVRRSFLKRLEYFFDENGELCGLAYAPRLAREESLPALFCGLPPDSVIRAADGRALPGSALGAAVRTECACAAYEDGGGEGEKAGENAFTGLLRGVYARRPAFGLLAEARVTIHSSAPSRAKDPGAGRAYTVSCIVPVYNVGRYLNNAAYNPLSTAIESIINQSIGFAESIRLILNTENATDEDISICKDYRIKYPNNIVLADSTDEALALATGDYVWFPFESGFIPLSVECVQDLIYNYGVAAVESITAFPKKFIAADTAMLPEELPSIETLYERVTAEPTTQDSDIDFTALTDKVSAGLIGVTDAAIQQSSNLTYRQKLYLLNVKYGKSREIDFEKPQSISVDIFEVSEKNGNITILGCCDLPDYDNIHIAAYYNDTLYSCEYVQPSGRIGIEKAIVGHKVFQITVPFAVDGQLAFYAEINGYGAYAVTLKYGENCRLRNRKGSFLIGDKTIITRLTDSKWAVRESDSETLKSAVAYYNKSGLAFSEDDAQVFNRYTSQYPFLSNRKIWLFETTDDEERNTALKELYDYCADKVEDTDLYFVGRTDETAEDTLQNNVVYGTTSHKLLSLFAERIISFADEYSEVQPFGGQYSLYLPLLKGEFVPLLYDDNADLRKFLTEIKIVADDLKDYLYVRTFYRQGYANSRIEPMNVMFSFDENLAKYAPVTMISLYRNHIGISINIYVVYVNLSETAMNLMRATAEEYHQEIFFIKCHDPEKYNEFDKYSGTFECYFDLVAQSYLPKMLSRVLYLDVDTFVCKNISSLYYADFEDNYLIAIPDVGNDMRGSQKIENPVELAAQGQGFNSGVIVINLERFRKEKITVDTYTGIIRQLKEKGIQYFGDQALFNVFMLGKPVKYMSYLYNFLWIEHEKQNACLREYDVENVYIFHCGGSEYKPWTVRLRKEDISLYEERFYIKKHRITDRIVYINQAWWEYAKYAINYYELWSEAVSYKHLLSVINFPLIEYWKFEASTKGK